MSSSNTNSTASTSQDQHNNPGLLTSHAQYLKGATVGAVGSVTGSEAWKEAGETQKHDAVEAMRRAGETRDPAQSGYGKLEEVAGRVTGCEGMEREGAASAKKD